MPAGSPTPPEPVQPATPVPAAASPQRPHRLPPDVRLALVGIEGVEGLTTEQVNDALARGARFVVFDQVVSVVLLSFRRRSPIFFVTSKEDVKRRRRRYLLITAVFGWWGFPFGFIWTPMSLSRTLRGGVDFTEAVIEAAWADAEAPVEPAHTAVAPLIDVAAPAPPARPGWYADPDGGARQRYWDGTRWTDQVTQ